VCACKGAALPKLPARDVDRLVELYETGFSLAETARLGHVAPTTAYKYLLERGVEMRPRGGNQNHPSTLTTADVLATVRLYEAGYSTVEIGHVLGKSVSTVNYRLRQAGVQLRSRGESNHLRNKRRRKNEV